MDLRDCTASLGNLKDALEQQHISMQVARGLLAQMQERLARSEQDLVALAKLKAHQRERASVPTPIRDNAETPKPGT